MIRNFRSFTWKDTNLRVACDRFEVVTEAVVRHRGALESYIEGHPEYRSTLEPLPVDPDAPEIAIRMAKAAKKTGLGPMASVAGTLAQIGAEAAVADGCQEVIVENGGDIFVVSRGPVIIGIYAGENAIGSRLAFRLSPEDLPLALCSSSSTMGHSLSFGGCELATVVAKEAALADSAATLVGNRIRSLGDMEGVLEEVGAVPGIQGILAVKDGQLGLCGDLPEIVQNQDAASPSKITRDRRSGISRPGSWVVDSSEPRE